MSCQVRNKLRKILEVDEAIPNLSQAEREAEVEKNYRWNFLFNVLDGASFGFGSSFISASTVVPLFISKLTANPIWIGMAAMIAQAGWYLPQIFTANVVERIPRKKPIVAKLGLFLERLPVWFLIVAALISQKNPTLALVIFLTCLSWHTLGAGVVATAWQDLISRLFATHKRGRFFGIAQFLAAGTGAVGALISTYLFRTCPFPKSFIIVFCFAATGITISWFFFSLVRETPHPVQSKMNGRQYFSSLPEIIRNDHNFRKFLIARMVLAFGNMGLGFVTVSAVNHWHVPDHTVGIYTAVFLLSQTIGNLGFGFMADHFGHKLPLEISGLSASLAFILVWQAPSSGWFILIFILLGIASSAILVSGILVVMEFCEPQKVPTYVGLSNSASGLATMVAPMVGAILAGLSYTHLFVTSSLVSLLAFILLHWFVKEPRKVGVGLTR